MLSYSDKLHHGMSNPIEWQTTKYYICNFPIDVKVKAPNFNKKEIKYVGFFIRKEKKFIRNVLDKDDLKKSSNNINH